MKDDEFFPLKQVCRYINKAPQDITDFIFIFHIWGYILNNNTNI